VAHQWSSSVGSHHTSTEAASLAACETNNPLQVSSAAIQVYTLPHDAISIRRLSTGHGHSYAYMMPQLIQLESNVNLHHKQTNNSSTWKKRNLLTTHAFLRRRATTQTNTRQHPLLTSTVIFSLTYLLTNLPTY